MVPAGDGRIENARARRGILREINGSYNSPSPSPSYFLFQISALPPISMQMDICWNGGEIGKKFRNPLLLRRFQNLDHYLARKVARNFSYPNQTRHPTWRSRQMPSQIDLVELPQKSGHSVWAKFCPICVRMTEREMEDGRKGDCRGKSDPPSLGPGQRRHGIFHPRSTGSMEASV